MDQVRKHNFLHRIILHLLTCSRDQFGLGQTRSLPGFPRLEMVGEDEARDWNLKITAASIEDEGMYQCQVLSSPHNPPIRSSVARLVVVIPSGPPQIVGSSSLVLAAGQEGQVSCEARGGRPATPLPQGARWGWEGRAAADPCRAETQAAAGVAERGRAAVNLHRDRRRQPAGPR